MIIGEVQKNEKERIRVTISEFKNHKFIDCRICWPDGNEWKPGKKGIAMNAKCIGDVINLLKQAREELAKDE